MLHTSLIGEVIVASELQVVQGALHVEEEGVAAPAREKAVVADLRHLRLPSCRDRRPLEDGLPAVARPGGLRALDAAQRRGVCSTFGRREPHAVGDIGDDIAVRVNLQLVDGLGREGLGGGGPRRLLRGGRVHVHDQDRLARVPWLGEGIQISEIQARVSAREPEIGTGVMV